MQRFFSRLFATRQPAPAARKNRRSFRPATNGLEPRQMLTATALGVVAPTAHVAAVTVAPKLAPSSDAIALKYAALGGAGGFLGSPTTPELIGPNGGRFEDFQHGAIYDTQATGAHEVHGAILGKYNNLGGPAGFLGYPRTDELAAAGGGRYEVFQGGQVYWTQATGAHEVHGAILANYVGAGGSGSFLGFPTSDEFAAPNGGRESTFKGGNVYYTPSTNAHSVHGAILGKYVAEGGPAGLLGYPTSDEMAAAGGGRYSVFKGGQVYWTQATGAHEVHGAILANYVGAGGSGSFLGFPTSDEFAAPSGGRESTFQGGNIYYTQATGAHSVHGAILKAYLNDVDGPSGLLGYPTSDETSLFGSEGRVSHFQHGAIEYLSASGQIIVVQG